MDQQQWNQGEASQPVQPEAQPVAPMSPNYTGESSFEPSTDGSNPISSRAGGFGMDMSSAPAYVYALGRIEARFPTLSVEKEFAHATGKAETSGLTDRKVLQQVLSQKQNRYLARQLCWVFIVEGLETYILTPRDNTDIELLIEALRPTPRPTDVEVIVGLRGAIAPPQWCNGLMIPTVLFDQLYWFDIDSLVKSIPRPKGIPAEQFESTVEEVFTRIMGLANNVGAADEHRALNYLAIRYPSIYSVCAEAFGRDSSLTGVHAHASYRSAARRIMEVIFSFTNRKTDLTEKYFTRVDVTEEFPFLVSKLSPYYDR
jgi:hypothetical protein